MKEGEKILYKQDIEGVKGMNLEELEALYENRPNKKLPLIPYAPYIGLYQRGIRRFKPEKYDMEKRRIQKKYDIRIKQAEGRLRKVEKLKGKLRRKIDKQDKNLKEGNLGMRVGEPLAVYNRDAEQATVRKLKAYFHSRGFFNAEAAYDTTSRGRLVSVTYRVDRKKRYTIDSIYYAVPDDRVRQLLVSNSGASHFRKGQSYNQEQVVQERERINNLMLDNGYYDFSRQLLSFQVDTTLLGSHKVTMGVVIKNPPGRSNHKIYTIDSVIFTTDADLKGQRSGKRKSESYNRVSYRYYDKRYTERLLDWRLFLYPDSMYSKANTLETQRQFSNLDIFKFININYDTIGGQFIANVFTSPLRRYQTSTEAGVNVSQGLPGPFFNFNLKNRNTFKGLEVTELNGRIGFEGLGGAADKGNNYASLEYGANLSLTFPQFLFPFGERFKSRIGRFNPQTKLRSGLTYTDRPEYKRSNWSSSISYRWQQRQNRIYSLTIADLSYILSDITDADFQQTLEGFRRQGNNLINSFRNSFVSSSTFSVTNNYNDYGNKKQKSAYWLYSIEAGGNLFNSPARRILDEGIELFSFMKLRSDYRTTIPINSKESLAFRLYAGYALPYGDNETLPYEKFFFAGGSNSIRAWEPRRLGPGSYNPLDAQGNYSNNFEQAGEVILESSIEYRHRIVGFVHGAVFIDAGNIWTVREDKSRPGANFEFNRFYNEIALGTGYGLRFDFNFLLMRFDAGLKIYDPAGPKGARFIGDSGFRAPAYENYSRLVFNIGIGYPF